MHTFHKLVPCDRIAACLYGRVRMLVVFHCDGSWCSGVCPRVTRAGVQGTSYLSMLDQRVYGLR
jgi:hypothetical protein